ncbi:MAG TPA: NAD-dependent epimerase/dehydratase family protein [Candidatus Dormibacteraeota bacterium]|nr:NAD-dependent epimerase/dehydratase family protein [Candidatus Dormibacteraeota bacterium]
MKIEGKRVLVTGGAGFVGSHLVDILATSNHVTVLDDFSVGTHENLSSSPNVAVVRGDVRDRDGIEAAVKQSDVVFHLAVVCLRVSIPDPMASHLVNDLGTLNLLLAALDSRVQRFVYVSSSEVYGTAKRAPMDEDHPLNPMTPYAAAKLAGEAYTHSFHRTYGLPVTVVRPFNVYGPREHADGPSGELIPRFVARAVAHKPLVVFGDGLQTRDFTWVGDTVRGILMAAECDGLVGDCVNIARGQEVSVLQVAHLVQELFGTRVPIHHDADRPGDVRRHLAGVERARSHMGFAASVGIEEGLSRYVDWVRSLPGQPSTGLESEEARNWQLASATGA